MGPLSLNVNIQILLQVSIYSYSTLLKNLRPFNSKRKKNWGGEGTDVHRLDLKLLFCEMNKRIIHWTS